MRVLNKGQKQFNNRKFQPNKFTKSTTANRIELKFNAQLHIHDSYKSRAPSFVKNFVQKLLFELVVCKLEVRTILKYHTFKQGWLCGTFRICVLHTSHLEPYRTSLQFLKRIMPTYRNRTITKNAYLPVYRTS